MSTGNITVRVHNNDGAGFSEEVIVPDGTTLGEMLASHGHLNDANNYTISVNGEAGSLRSRAMQDGDRVTIAPNNVKGA